MDKSINDLVTPLSQLQKEIMVRKIGGSSRMK